MKIVISGTSGVGKSTTVKLVKEYFEKSGKEVVVLSEMVLESPFFDLFYESLEEWGFLGQIEFILSRFKQWVKIEEEFKNKNKKKYVIIYDRHFLEDVIFSELRSVRNAVPQPISNAYNVIYNDLIKKIDIYEKPDFFILLRATYDTVVERQFSQRGRTQEMNEENNINNKFWQDLYYRYYGSKKYRKLFQDNSKKFVQLDTDDCEPKEVLNKVIRYVEKRFK
ncbi:MAG: deoxyguanosine kinase [Candidatus Tyloplasma litorale]|nr:MAG: deoxyguanosine kinase [Mycoplasmatales bacterium]